MLLVVNMYRPETRTVEGLKEIKDEIEKAAKINFTGIVNNSNLGNETTIETVKKSFDFIEKASQEFKLPIFATCIREDLFNDSVINKQDTLPLKLIKYGEW